MGKLDGKVAIVTGSSGGIGRVAALEFAREGARVVVHYRSRESHALQVIKRIEEPGSEAIAARIDFAKRHQAEDEAIAMVKEAVHAFGRIDILVNLAGHPAKSEWNKRFLEISIEDFFKPIDVDLFATFVCSKAVAPQMLKQKAGVIINTSSTPAIAGHSKGFTFTVAKAAILGLTKALAWELAPFVRVNAVALGNIMTDWVEELTPKEREEARAEALLQRFGEPLDVARTLVFLASDDSSFVNGQTIVIDGEAVMR